MGYERNDRSYGNRGYGDRGYGYDADRSRGGYDRNDPRDRGFFERAGDEVRSWFGDEEAERRRRYDEQYDERYDRQREGGSRYGAARQGGYAGNDYPRYARSNSAGGSYGGGSYSGGGYSGSYGSEGERERERNFGSSYDDGGNPDYGRGSSGRDWRESEYRALYGRGGAGYDRDRDTQRDDPHGYHSWRSQQISAFDRDYDEYRRENQSRFASEFAAWRENRQTQRSSLRQAKEHQEVVGSDGQHVGTVDHVRGDRILLTKTDKDAGGHHHSIPSAWIQSVDDKVHISKTAEQAHQAWRDEENNRGLFGRDDDRGGADLDRSFSGTY